MIIWRTNITFFFICLVGGVGVGWCMLHFAAAACWFEAFLFSIPACCCGRAGHILCHAPQIIPLKALPSGVALGREALTWDVSLPQDMWTQNTKR